MKDSSAGPLSFPVHVARLPKKGMPVEIEPAAEERAALAAEHDLITVDRLRAELHVTAWKRDGIKVSGRLAAQISQACIVTLEPVVQRIDEDIEAVFLPEGSKLAVPPKGDQGEIVLDAEGPDSPEIFSGDTIDVGQLVEEYFVLAIDPYPRKAGVALEPAGDDGEEKRGPLFEKLQALKKKL